MSNLLRRIRPRRAADENPETAETTAALAPGSRREDAARAFPAGTDPDRAHERRDSRRRGPARRRLRHLRRVRELLLRDLGGYVYELHRAGGAAHAEPGVMTAKLDRLTELDAERDELEERLGDRSGELLLREPGIGGRCPTCGELHGSEARFCATCGMPLAPGAARPRPALTQASEERSAFAPAEPAALAAGAAPAAETLVHDAEPVPEPVATDPAADIPDAQLADAPAPPADEAAVQPPAPAAETPGAPGTQPTQPLEAAPSDWLPAEEPRR